MVEAELIRCHWSFASYWSSFAGYLSGFNSILSVLDHNWADILWIGTVQ